MVCCRLQVAARPAPLAARKCVSTWVSTCYPEKASLLGQLYNLRPGTGQVLIQINQTTSQLSGASDGSTPYSIYFLDLPGFLCPLPNPILFPGWTDRSLWPHLGSYYAYACLPLYCSSLCLSNL